MKKIYLIRHCEPDFGEKRVFLGSTDLPLSNHGRAEAKRIGGIISALGVAKVYSSPLRRSVETAEAIGLPVQKVDALREIYLGEWEGLTKREVMNRWPDVFEARGKAPHAVVPPGGEALESVRKRAVEALYAIADEAGGDAAVVAHSMVNRVLISHIECRPLSAAFELELPYGCVTEIISDGERLTIAGKK